MTKGSIQEIQEDIKIVYIQHECLAHECTGVSSGGMGQ